MTEERWDAGAKSKSVDAGIGAGWESEQPVLEVSGLRKLYSNRRGVSRMSFALRRGDIFGLLGSNGSGKTTSIKSICGLCSYEGDIRLFGRSVADDTRNALRNVGCIVEAPAFHGGLSAERNLKLAASHYMKGGAEIEAAVSWALEAVGLARYRKDRAERFSLGMKARLALALCFVSKPGFMALDEPLNGLDIEGMVEIRNIITQQARASGATFLISSHLAAEIEKTCNRLGVMDAGELLETSSMDDVMRFHGSVEAYYIETLRKHRGQGQSPVAPGQSPVAPGQRPDQGSSQRSEQQPPYSGQQPPYSEPQPRYSEQLYSEPYSGQQPPYGEPPYSEPQPQLQHSEQQPPYGEPRYSEPQPQLQRSEQPYSGQPYSGQQLRPSEQQPPYSEPQPQLQHSEQAWQKGSGEVTP